MSTIRTYEEINDKIRAKKAVVVTAEEMTHIVAEQGVAEAARQVDVVTTGTFGPMCSSGAMINVGHANPRMKITKAWFNGVSAYCGIAAVDLYLGATELVEGDPANWVFPGKFSYGGAHVIEGLVRGQGGGAASRGLRHGLLSSERVAAVIHVAGPALCLSPQSAELLSEL